MYCASCGHANDNNAYKCVACGAVLQGWSAEAAAPSAGSAPADGTPAGPLSPPPLPPVQLSPATTPAQPVPFNQRPHVPNHLVWAILSTLCCCLPGGIVAIVYAAQVDGKLAAGDIAGAQASSRSAATWCWVSVIVGIVAGCAYSALLVFNNGMR